MISPTDKQKQYSRQYYLKHRDKVLLRSNNSYRTANPSAKRYKQPKTQEDIKQHKTKVHQIALEYYHKTKQRQLSYGKERYMLHKDLKEYKDKVRLSNKQYYAINKSKLLKQQYAYRYKKYHSDPKYAFIASVRSNITKYLNSTGHSKNSTGILLHSEDLIGCTREDLIKHIESQFDSNMNWSNRAIYWNIDHIIPVSYFLKN